MQSLPKSLTSIINRHAHRRGLEHEARIKSELTAQLLKARMDGASLPDLTAMLDKLEAAQPAG